MVRVRIGLGLDFEFAAFQHILIFRKRHFTYIATGLVAFCQTLI